MHLAESDMAVYVFTLREHYKYYYYLYHLKKLVMTKDCKKSIL